MNAGSIDRVAVLGLGTMGHAIAQVFAVAGCRVACYDSQEAARQTLVIRVEANLKEMIAADLLDERTARQTLARLYLCDHEQTALTDAQFVTEAIAEDLDAKQSLLARVEASISPQTIVASNSSTFPISQSAARMSRPQRAIVTHWFNPPHIVPTVEVVPGSETAPETVETSMALLERLGKSAVLLHQEIPGFLVNRVQMAMIREVWDLLERGIATPNDIDRAIRGSLGFRLAAIGPLEVCDFGGLDVWARVYRNLAPEIRSDADLPQVIERLVSRGHYGVKSGQGVFAYGGGEIEAKRRERDRRFLELARLFYGRNRRGDDTQARP